MDRPLGNMATRKCAPAGPPQELPQRRTVLYRARRAEVGLAVTSLAFALAGLAGCVAPHRGVPRDLASQAEVADFPGIRAWAGHNSEALEKSIVDSIQAVQRENPKGLVGRSGTVDLLSLSGGGADGAFGAGLLCGWTSAGSRPTFKLVTGISTGALIAPFAFLGPQYDSVLERFYTTTATRDVMSRKLFGGLLTDSMASTAPLMRLLTQCVDDNVMQAVAAAHRQGRRLFIGTTDLNTGNLVVWDMGAIAASGRPRAADLFRKVMLASASIPVAFPPVRFSVIAGGKTYDELHVDGGVMTSMFLYGILLDVNRLAHKADVAEIPPLRLYVIRNSKLNPPWQDVQPAILSIAGRSVGCLLATHALGDIYRVYTVGTRDGMEFRLAYIPEDFNEVAKEPFDPLYMRQLFDLGHGLAATGRAWQNVPPGYGD